MISFVAGVLAEKSAPFLVIDVNGLGYELQASLNTFAQLPKLGEACRLLTHFVVREDAQLLYGFADDAERRLFRALLKVNGVGPKLALAILSGMDNQEFAQCILGKDIAALVRLPGVGKKTAERLVVEMKDRMAEWSNDSTTESPVAAPTSHSAMLADAEAAMIALGYSPTEAARALAKQDLNAFSDTEELVRAVLRTMLQK